MNREREIDSFIAGLWDMAKAYGLGTPESRAIVTAIEHAIADRSASAPRRETGVARKGESSGADRQSPNGDSNA